jgi:trehalose-phosphatase
MTYTPQQIADRLLKAERVWLFLDYDGTLDEFAPTPDHILPNPEVIELVTHLAQLQHICVAVISGRRLSQIQVLLPVPGILLAGTYGIEMLLPNGERMDRIELDLVRPALDNLKPRWMQLIANRYDFFLEDKAWTLALHARFAEASEADEVLSIARRLASEVMRSDLFRILDGHRFLEIGPILAHKGRMVDYLLDRYAWPGAVPIYIGDDDKDEEAFAAIKARHGLAIVVAAQPRKTLADSRLESPASVRQWLNEIITAPNRFYCIRSMDNTAFFENGGK